MELKWRFWIGILVGCLIYGGLENYISGYFDSPLLMILVGLVVAVLLGVGFRR
jgi:hypothetical protein